MLSTLTVGLLAFGQQGDVPAPDAVPVQDLTPPPDAVMETSVVQVSHRESALDRRVTAMHSEQGFVFKQQVEEVLLYAAVMNPKGDRIVSGLNDNAFAVYEDGESQKVTYVRMANIPIALGIVIDNSGSMRTKRPAVNQAALNFVQAGSPADEVFLVNFDSEYRLDQDFTSDAKRLGEALEQLQSMGGTALYDAVIASADHLAGGATLERRVLLVVTDGEDNASRNTLEDALHSAQQENGPTIYAIGILGSEGPRKEAKRALKRLAETTGGIAYFPKDLEDVDAITKAVAQDIRNQYAIAYQPKRPASEGGFRSVRVEARAGKDRLKVRTKKGYFAGTRKIANTQPLQR